MSPNVTFKSIIVNFLNRYFSYLHGKSVENPHLTKSLILHLIIIIAISGMLPMCSTEIEKPKVIAVSIMPMGEAPKTAPEVKKTAPVAPPKEAKKPDEATKMEKAEKPKPIAKPAEKKPAPKKVEKKPEPEKKKQEQQKKDERDQEGKKKLLKDLEKKDQAKLDNIMDQAASEEPAQNSGKSDVIDPALVNEIMGKIQSQISECWNIPIGAKDVENMHVRLGISLTPQGVVTDVKILDQMQYTTDNAYRVVADSALWAVKECSPLQGLPADKYNLWKEIEFTFDPSKAL